ncbi:MAG: hypothetical protein ACR2NZ_14310 [Rubripirellula sp.]
MILWLAGAFGATGSLHAAETVRAELGVETAWTGQAVPLIVTLYSPGPFSGTASFDLPKIARTNFVLQGSPLVGSETVEGDSYITQRHELMLYTQQSGKVVIPPFGVRFAGAKSFTTKPEPMEGMTTELAFESKRPPGTEGMSMVVCATQMEVEQTWKPSDVTNLKQGDLIIRQISREADGTTAMMLTPIQPVAEEGVQAYQGRPEVEDISVRGVTEAKRVDTVRYQFPQAGQFAIPSIELTWWDPDQEELQRKTLDGLQVSVAVDPDAPKSDAAAPAKESKRSSLWLFLFLVSGIAIAAAKPVLALVRRARERYHRPESVAIRELKAACLDDDASAAYVALLSWWRYSDVNVGQGLEQAIEQSDSETLVVQWRQLSSGLYSRDNDESRWKGSSLWNAFDSWRRDCERFGERQDRNRLPSLNPPLPSRTSSS